MRTALVYRLSPSSSKRLISTMLSLMEVDLRKLRNSFIVTFMAAQHCLMISAKDRASSRMDRTLNIYRRISTSSIASVTSSSAWDSKRISSRSIGVIKARASARFRSCLAMSAACSATWISFIRSCTASGS